MPPPNAKLLSAPIHKPPTPRLWGSDSPPSSPAVRGREVPRKSGRTPSLARVALKLINAGKLRPDLSGPGVPEVSPTPRSRRKKKKSLRPALVLPPLPCLDPGQERALGDPECYPRVRVSKRVLGREKG